MEAEFSTKVWNWYAEDEYEKLLLFCQLCSGLEFLAMEAAEQSSSIPYCPACEVWSDKILRIYDFENNFGNSLPASIKAQLSLLFELCDNLSSEAFHCDDQLIFHNQEWEAVRQASRDVMSSISWSTLKAYAAEFEGRSRNILYGVPYNET